MKLKLLDSITIVVGNQLLVPGPVVTIAMLVTRGGVTVEVERIVVSMGVEMTVVSTGVVSTEVVS
ncbi:hypothetical protein NPN18_25785, partial [Vibrio parahaemolyticus]|nr:hypothetical protein [Vibrio parahaemolyticus]